MAKEKLLATLTIHGAPKMGNERRQKLARWLDRQKELLLTENKELATRFTAKYYESGRSRS